MTNERAIELLSEYEPLYLDTPAGKEFLEMRDLAIQALEKQIAKKHDVRLSGYHMAHFCPRCNEYNYKIYNPNNCGHCGQALDWSDTE